jgi:hypothetical protein
LLGGVLSVVVDLLDAPLNLGPGSQVNIALDGVNVLANGVSYPLVTYSSPQIVNLLTLQQVGLSLQGTLPPGSYDALELVVDPTQSNVVTANGTTYPMQFVMGNSPWGGHNHHHRNSSGNPALVGLEAPVTFSGASGGSVSIAVDFNVLESVYLSNGVANVNANLAVATQPASISGVVLNAAGQPVTSATVTATDANGKVDNVTTTASDGSFTLHALRAGPYTIGVLNSFTSASGNTVVANGNDTSSGPSLSVDLSPSDQLNVGSLSD